MAVHVVRTGETLWMIARKYGVQMQPIVDINGLLSAQTIIPGLALYIPQNGEVQLFSYRVKAGDTLWQIASRYQIQTQDLLAVNPRVQATQLQIGQEILVPSHRKLPLQTLGFLLPSTQTTELDEAAKNLTYVAIVAYSLTATGEVNALEDDEAAVKWSQQAGIVPLLMIRNFTDGEFSPELIGSILKDVTYRRNFYQSLLYVIRQKEYGGVSLDFEFIPPARRNDFNLFLAELKQELGDYILHVNVHAKAEDLPNNRIVGAYDYEAIGHTADIVAVMTMDYGYPTGPANPVAPIWWIEKIVQYATKQIQPQKLQIAFPLYGYSWKLNTTMTKAYSVLTAQHLATSTGAIIKYDEKAAAPWYLYWRGTQGNIMWFEDIRSYVEKYKLVELYGLLGVTFWHIGLPFPQNWAYMSKRYNVKKNGH